jgi:hypothetical protein
MLADSDPREASALVKEAYEEALRHGLPLADELATQLGR